ncbi:prepilin peptidase [Corynebacterium tuscaniense]|uniref:prepilin peptidase n=1 Tax=Corynebacterium tuscaniense TaxID=302449 RepID=UPI00123A23B2|nr:prepilin peptidase [Corynebacterium tuscaniense]KAA8745012.1 prepilin peptidase [Corynebacterium tuscaniense]
MFGGLIAHTYLVALAVATLVALVWTVALVVWDVREQRLPNALTLSAAAVAVTVCFFYPTGWWGLLWPGMFVAVALAAPNTNPGIRTHAGIGGGDIKLAVSLGVAAALAGGVMGVLGAMLLSSAITVFVLLMARQSGMAHGPSMLIAAWLVVIACALA